MFFQPLFKVQANWDIFHNAMNKVLGISFLCMFGTVCLAGEADVTEVAVEKTGDTLYDFNVTVLHQDSGWKHYANKWEILDSHGKVLATRTLYHPHVNEQPFTRTLADVVIPKNIKSVTVRAFDSVHEYGGREVSVVLPLK